MMKHLLLFKALCLVIPFAASAQSKIRSGPDTVAISQTEFVIRNNTRDVKGFLFNIGNGKTAFRGTGKAVQFTAGTQGAPVAGTTVYTNAAFKSSRVKAWRNGYLQPNADLNGIRFNPTLGAITFHPALAQNDRIYIESIFATED